MVQDLGLVEKEVLKAIGNVGFRLLDEDKTFLHPPIVNEGFHDFLSHLLGVLSQLWLILKNELCYMLVNK
jgi:hypothetical protein